MMEATRNLRTVFRAVGGPTQRCAVVKDGVVVNVVEVGDAPWRPPAGCSLVPSTDAGVGDLYDGARFSRPAAAAPAPSVRERPSVAERLADVERRLAELEVRVKA
ncbi:MAG TPA: hypothetical protein VNK52_04465 [Hyphomicrobiaceae bacterium]|nr:hypothetical protein [Hyphomicrobiaceae bacterium]